MKKKPLNRPISWSYDDK